MQKTMIWPCIAMACLVFLVWGAMFRQRFAEIRAKKLRADQLDTPARVAAALLNSKAADNFRNLFEMPILFYLAAIIIGTSWSPSQGEIVYSWLFVVFRFGHSAIQVSINRVMWRFAAYLASCLALAALWLDIAVHVIAA